jgi:hypothetical protein
MDQRPLVGFTPEMSVIVPEFMLACQHHVSHSDTLEDNCALTLLQDAFIYSDSACTQHVTNIVMGNQGISQDYKWDKFGEGACVHPNSPIYIQWGK